MTHIGRKRTIGIALESVAGVAETPTMYIPFLDLTLQERHTPIADISAKGVRDLEGGASVEGKKWSEGAVEVVLDPKTAPYWLAMALGSIESEADGSNYKHTITRATNSPVTATILKDSVVDKLNFTNLMANQLELSFADDVVRLRADLFGKYPEAGTGVATVEKELTLYTFGNATVNVGSSKDVKIRDLTLTIENNAELLYAPNDVDVESIVAKGFRVSGSFTLKFESETQKEAFRDLDKQAMVISFSNGANDKVELTIPSFRVDSWQETGSNDDIMHEEINFVAEYDSATSKTISAEVINQTEEYLTLES